MMVLLASSCSDEDIVSDTLDQDALAEGTYLYMVADFQAGSTSSTRASSTYSDGSLAESYVDFSNSAFYFYTASGNYLSSGTIAYSAKNGYDTSTLQDIEDATGLVCLGPTTAIPSQMLTVLNVPADTLNKYFADKSLSDAMKALAWTLPTYTTSTDVTSGDFVMVSALRWVTDDDNNSGSLSCGTTVTNTNLYTSFNDAYAALQQHENSSTTATTSDDDDDDDTESSIEEIFVEREVAKVVVSAESLATNNTSSTYTLDTSDEDAYTSDDAYTVLTSNDGTPLSFPIYTAKGIGTVYVAVVVDGMAANGCNPYGYMAKQYDTAWGDEVTDEWYDTGDDTSESSTAQRFLWALDDNYKLYSATSSDDDEGVTTYDQCLITQSSTSDAAATTYQVNATENLYKITAQEGYCFDGLQYGTWNGTDGKDGKAAYFHENTASKAAQNQFAQTQRPSCVTCALFTSHLLISNPEYAGTTSGISTNTFQSVSNCLRDQFYGGSDGYTQKTGSSTYAYGADIQDTQTTTTDDDGNETTSTTAEVVGDLYYYRGAFFTRYAIAELIADWLTDQGYYLGAAESDNSSATSYYAYVGATDITALSFSARDADSSTDGTQVDNTGRVVLATIDMGSSGTQQIYTVDNGSTDEGSVTSLSDDDAYDDNDNQTFIVDTPRRKASTSTTYTFTGLYKKSGSTPDPTTDTEVAEATDGVITLTASSSDGIVSAVNSGLSVISDVTTDEDDGTYGGLACFTDGACFYQAPIEQLTAKTDIDGIDSDISDATNGDTYYGLIRNHCYDINLQSISWIGWAVFDKDEPLVYIPAKANEYIISATVSIINWYEESTNKVAL